MQQTHVMWSNKSRLKRQQIFLATAIQRSKGYIIIFEIFASLPVFYIILQYPKRLLSKNTYDNGYTMVLIDLWKPIFSKLTMKENPLYRFSHLHSAHCCIADSFLIILIHAWENSGAKPLNILILWCPIIRNLKNKKGNARTITCSASTKPFFPLIYGDPMTLTLGQGRKKLMIFKL